MVQMMFFLVEMFQSKINFQGNLKLVESGRTFSFAKPDVIEYQNQTNCLAKTTAEKIGAGYLNFLYSLIITFLYLFILYYYRNIMLFFEALTFAMRNPSGMVF